jgi:hypothetical protein
MNGHIALPSPRRQRGQILPIFAGGLVALLLVGALVVDLGFVFMTKRHEQNAADPGAVAAARYIRPTPDVPAMWTAACFYALENDFRPTRTDSGGPCDSGQPVDDSLLTVNYPPSRSAGEFAGDRGYVEVVIRRPQESFLAAVIGISAFTVESSAVAANDDATGGSSSLVALNASKCSAGKINGGGGAGGISIFPASGVTDPGGYLQVNSDCASGGGEADDDACSQVSSGALVMDGGSYLEAPGMYLVGTCDSNGNSGTIDVDSIDEATSFLGDPLSLIRPPSPTDLTIRQACSGPPSTAIDPKQCRIQADVTLDPGTYYGGWAVSKNGVQVTLNPGIYIIAGGGIDVSQDISSVGGRVMIFSTDASATFRDQCAAGTATNLDGCQNLIKITGQGDINLTGLSFTTPCPPYNYSSCPYGGMLIWQDGHGSGAAIFASDPASKRCNVELSGGSSLYLTGTIYSACGNVKITGNNNSSGCDTGLNCAAVQIIADTWDVGGAAVLEMPYDPDDFYHLTLKGLVR